MMHTSTFNLLQRDFLLELEPAQVAATGVIVDLFKQAHTQLWHIITV